LEVPEDVQEGKGLLDHASPASTMVPTDPWVSPLFGYQEPDGAEGTAVPSPFLMPKCDPSSWSADDAEEVWGFDLKPIGGSGGFDEAFDVEFKLEGLSHLENSLATLLGDFMKPAGSGKVGATADEASTGTSGGAETPPLTDSTLESPPPGQMSPAPASEAEEVRAETPEAEAPPEVKSEKPAAGWLASPRPNDELPAASEAEHTMSLKNLPKKWNAEQLEKMLGEKGLMHEVDFLYVPKDLKIKNCNQGFAVVNVRTAAARDALTAALHGVTVKKAFPGCSASGTCEVSDAPVQGKAANVCKLQKSGLLLSMLAGTPEWMPRIFDKDGHQLDFPQESV